MPISAGKRFFGDSYWCEREIIGAWQVTGITRADFLGAFNHPNFQTGNHALISSTYNQLNGVTGARVIQPSLQFVF